MRRFILTVLLVPLGGGLFSACSATGGGPQVASLTPVAMPVVAEEALAP